MVADFEQGALKSGLGEHGIFGWRFGIAFEHDGGCSVGHVEDERVVVGGYGSRLVPGEGREDGDLGCAEGERIAGAECADADVEARSFVEQFFVRTVAWIVANP